MMKNSQKSKQKEGIETNDDKFTDEFIRFEDGDLNSDLNDPIARNGKKAKSILR